MRFQDRHEAGRTLAPRLAEYAGRSDVIVLALPRGGVPVAYEVAQAIGAPLDVFLVRKLGVPGQVELAMGAIASGGVQVLNEEVVRYLNIPDQVIDQVAQEELRELERRERLYRGDRPLPELEGRIVILVDDGLATGSSMRAAVQSLLQHRPKRIVVAAPVASQTTCESFNDLTHEVVCVCGMTRDPFYAVGLWYEDFTQTSDEEVRELLAQAAREHRLASPAGALTLPPANSQNHASPPQ